MSRRLLPVSVLMVLMSAGLPILLARGAEKFVVSEVIIQGNQRMTTEQIKVRMRTQAGKEYDRAALDEDVREMYKTRQFSNIQTFAEPDGAGKVKVYFLFRDLPNQVQKVTFLGANHLKEEDLRKETGVRPGMPLNPQLNREGCQKILSKYEEQGRSFASCELLKGGQLGDAEVVYQITEGPKVKVRDIQFTGNTFISSAKLAARIKSLSAWFHVVGGIYNRQKADSDIKELTKWYRSFGYQDVKVSLETQRLADGGEVTLIFHIQEGERRVHAEEGKPAQATASSDKKAKKRPPARVGQIFITGNEWISDKSILAHIPLSPGQVLTFPDFQRAEKNLADLGLFVVDPATGVHPTITVLDREGDSVYKDILITVKEKKAKDMGDKPK